MAENRSFIHHELPSRTDSKGRTTIYCRKCGRAISREINPVIRSVTACAICIMKEQGIDNPEDHVLPSYQMSIGVDGLPIPLDADLSQEGGILVLYPEGDPRQSKVPMVGGLFGTVRSLFRVLGFDMPEKAEPPSKEVAVRKGGTGLYGEKKGKE